MLFQTQKGDFSIFRFLNCESLMMEKLVKKKKPKTRLNGLLEASSCEST